MTDNRNLLLAIILAIAILAGFQYYKSIRYPTPPQEPAQQAETTKGGKATTPAAPATAGGGSTGTTAQRAPASGVPTAPGSSTPPVPGTPAEGKAVAATVSRTAALAESPRIPIKTPSLSGSIDLKGGRIDDLVLSDYRETVDPKSPHIELLSPSGAPHAYYAEFGWIATSGVKLPTADTLWTADGKTLTPEKPLTLSWNNGEGLIFKRTISVDKHYMFTVSQSVENTGGAPVELYPYGLTVRHGLPETTGYYILHEGPLGVFNGSLEEVSYKDLNEKGSIEQESTGGWIGITDKYWLTALIPDQKSKDLTRFFHNRINGEDKYQVDYRGPAMTVAPKSSVQTTDHFFAGAKVVSLLDHYGSQLNVPHLDKAVDFGWFYFLTKPIFYALTYINDHVGNFGVSILILTVLIKGLFFPLANKSYRAMSKMRALQPEMEKIRERFGDDKARMNQEIMGLYKREGANPASGCLPMVIQIPVFFSLYKVLFVTIEMRQAPFFGWIHDLSVPDPILVFNLGGLIPWTPPHFLAIGIWPVIMGITMFLQQRLNPQPADPVQAKIFMFLPLMFTFMLGRFPSGLVIYWAWNNILSIIQQKVIMMRMGVK